MKHLLSFALLLWLLGSNAHASTFTVSCDNWVEQARHGCTIKLTGKIESGDADHLRKVLQKPLSGDWYYAQLLLDSPGGEVGEALLLADLVRAAMLGTTTARSPDNIQSGQRSSWQCVSACFLVWISGTERFSMSGTSKETGPIGIGLHRPYYSPEFYKSTPGKVAEVQQSMTIAVRDFLRREQVPEAFVDKMLTRSSREVYWLYESGDAFALNGRAAWFEEMMIARCQFDPVYDREAQSLIARGLGKRTAQESSERAYIAWRQRYNACEYAVRREAQAALRK